MLTVLFFASIRERLQASRLELPLVRDIDTAIDVLAREHGAIYAQVLRAANVIVAINQRVVERNAVLQAGDELAFYPPVTGG
jgi:molybdopterin synthase sulfur carrier subunit